MVFRYITAAFVAIVLMGVVPYARQSDPIFGTIRNDQPFFEQPINLTDNEAGATIVADLEAINGSLDPLLYLVDANGNIVAENDDRAPGDLNAQIIYAQTPAGEYTLIATRFGVTTGDTIGDFRLVYSVVPAQEIEEASDILYDVSDAALSAAGFPQLEQKPKAEWTVLAYYGGDTDLEAGVMNDLNEFEIAGGSTDTVRVVALLDRSPEFSTANGDWQTARLFEMSADISNDHETNAIATIDTHPLADLGRLDTGSGENLARFMVWAMKTYPAERYALAFASHGAGWRGVIADDTDLYSLISVPDLQRALRTVSEATATDRFDLLINDACSMGGVEYHAAMADFFDVSIASPEVVVNPALDMALLTRTLNDQPDINLNALGTILIDKYMDEDIVNRRGSDNAFLSHAVIDLGTIDPIVSAVNDFAAVVNTDPVLYSTAIGQARTTAYTYSVFIGGSTTIDLGNFMQQVIANSTDTALVDAARNVLQAIDSTQLYGRAGEAVQNRTSYYSVYFPEKSSNFQSEYLDDSPLKEWGRMLRNYFNAITPRLWVVTDSATTYHPPIAPDVTVTRVYPSVSSSAFPPTISVEIIGRRIATGALTIDAVNRDGTSYRIVETPILTEVLSEDGAALVNSWKSGVDQAVFNWLPLELPIITDGSTAEPEFLRRTGDNAALEGRYREPGNESWTDVSVIFDRNGVFQSAFSRGSTGSLADTTIDPDSEFQAYRYNVTPDGELKAEPGNLYIWPEDGLSWSNQPTASGTYNLGFLVRAFGGVSGFDTVQIDVDNDEPLTNSIGYADINLGINFQRPAGWTPVIDQGNWLTTTSPDENAIISVYYFRSLDNVFQIKNDVQERYGIDQVYYSTLYRDKGDLALLFDIGYQLDDGSTWSGRAVAFHRETALGGRGLVFTLDTRDGSAIEAEREALFNDLLESINFFDAEQLASLDTSQWEYAFVNRRIPYPVRTRWVSTIEGDWTVHRPPVGNAGRLAAIALIDGTDPLVALDRLLAQYGIPQSSATYRQYNGEYHDFETAQYTINRDGITVIGRLYVADINNRLYAMRFETPNNATADEVFRYTFEPMLDGLAPPGSANYVSGNRSAYVKSAIVTADDICRDIEWDTICYADRQGESLRAIYLENDELVARELNDNNSLDGIVAFQVGTLPDGGIDPFSVAVLNIQANLPNANEGDDVKLIFFGGATVFNEAAIPPGTVRNIEMVSNPESEAERFNMRYLPAPDAYINGAFDPGEVVEVVGRTEDGRWVRVKVPNDPARTGWVVRQLLLPATIDPANISFAEYNAWQALPISDPLRPYYSNMQNFEIYVTQGGVEQDALNGVLIQTSPSAQTIRLGINGAVFEVAGGSLFFWQAAVNGLETISSAEQEEIFDDTLARRRPSGWSSEVLSGSVRIQLVGTGSNIQQPVTVTSVAGTQVSFNADGSLNLSGVGSSAIGNALTNTLLTAGLTDDELTDLLSSQEALDNLDLLTTSALGLYFLNSVDVTTLDQYTFTEESLFDFVFGEAGAEDE